MSVENYGPGELDLAKCVGSHEGHCCYDESVHVCVSCHVYSCVSVFISTPSHSISGDRGTYTLVKVRTRGG